MSDGQPSIVIGVALCRAFGLDPDRVAAMTIELRAGEVAHVLVEFYPEPGELFSAIRGYELVEIEGERTATLKPEPSRPDPSLTEAVKREFRTETVEATSSSMQGGSIKETTFRTETKKLGNR